LLDSLLQEIICIFFKMADGFTVSALEKKLSELNETAISIQQLSLWLVHHKKHFNTIVGTWQEELVRSPIGRKLTVLYLANDVVQNIRKTKSELLVEWGNKMIETFNHLASVPFDDRTSDRIKRLILIWEQRQIFDKKLIAIITSIWNNKDKNRDRSQEREPSPHTPPLPQPTKRSATPPPHPSPKRQMSEHKETENRLAHLIGSSVEGMDGEEEDEINEEESFDPPDPEELIQAIQGLEDTATSDAQVREDISRLPRDVSDPAAIQRLDSGDAAEKLAAEVRAAAKLLEDYNERLESELRERRRVARMIYEFLVTQKTLVAGLEERIDTYKDKLDKVRSMEGEVKKHLSSLPNIPDTNGGDPFH